MESGILKKCKRLNCCIGIMHIISHYNIHLDKSQEKVFCKYENILKSMTNLFCRITFAPWLNNTPGRHTTLKQSFILYLAVKSMHIKNK